VRVRVRACADDMHVTGHVPRGVPGPLTHARLLRVGQPIGGSAEAVSQRPLHIHPFLLQDV